MPVVGASQIRFGGGAVAEEEAAKTEVSTFVSEQEILRFKAGFQSGGIKLERLAAISGVMVLRVSQSVNLLTVATMVRRAARFFS